MPEIVQDGVTYQLKLLATPEQIEERVRGLAKQISADFDGKLIYALCVLEDGFVFMADLVRALEGNVSCQFIKPYLTEHQRASGSMLEILFRPELDVAGKHVLLVRGVLQTGITTDFLIRHLTSRGAASIRLAAFVDRSSERRLSLRADYSGYELVENYVVGYGLGTPDFGRNLPYLAVLEGQAPPSANP